MAPEVRDLIEEGRLLWADGAHNLFEKAYVNAAENFGRAAVLTWSAAELVASKSPKDASCLAAESLAFEGLATCMRGRAEVDLDHRKRLMQEAAGLVSTADTALKGRSSVAVGFAGAITSAGMLNAFNGRVAGTGASRESSAMRMVAAAGSMERDDEARASSPLPRAALSSSYDTASGADQRPPHTASATAGIVEAWGFQRSRPIGAMGAVRTAAPAEVGRSSPGQRQPPRARAQTL